MQEAQIAPALDAEEPGGRLGEGLVLLLFAILTLAASAYVLATAEQNAVDDPAQRAARGEITGLHAQSLMRRAPTSSARSSRRPGSS